MTTTQQELGRCGKCGGKQAREQIEMEVDIVCRNCGRRQLAVEHLQVVRSAISGEMAGLPQRVGMERHITCAWSGCGMAFITYNGNQEYCSRRCGLEARLGRRHVARPRHA